MALTAAERMTLAETALRDLQNQEALLSQGLAEVRSNIQRHIGRMQLLQELADEEAAAAALPAEEPAPPAEEPPPAELVG